MVCESGADLSDFIDFGPIPLAALKALTLNLRRDILLSIYGN